MIEVATPSNTLSIELEEEAPETVYDVFGNRISAASGQYTGELTVQSNVIPPDLVSYTSPPRSARVDPIKTAEKIICFDVETTGTNPWDYRVIVCGFWDLSLPVSEQVTFSGWDEEKLIREIADYLNTEKPDILVCYNNGFDQRALLSRFMLYEIPVPGWNSIEQVDIMQILQRGTTKNIYSNQPTGSEEQWLKFLFGESKPYTIDECFEGVREGDLTRMILRNRTCVESEGSIYLLFRAVTDEKPMTGVETKPTAPHIEEAREAGVCLVACPACGAVNDVSCDSHNNRCWRCLGAIPDPTEANIVREELREYAFEKVGLSAKKK